MAGVFDRLHSEIGSDEEDEGGLSILDLADLPAGQRKLMRLMLREVELTDRELREAVASWPEEDHMSDDELKSTLDALVSNLWLIRMGEERLRYRANLRRKPGSVVAKSIWGDLDARIAQSSSADPTEE
jgi:hypothetical protein